MKYLLLLLTLNAYAQFKVIITPDNPKHGELSIDAESQEDAQQKLIKWIDRQKVYKGVWSESQDGSIVERVIQDLEGNEITQYLSQIILASRLKTAPLSKLPKKLRRKREKMRLHRSKR
jgi:hypothetical protein